MVSATVLLGAPTALGGKRPQPVSLWEHDFHSILPLGSDFFQLEGYRGAIGLMATAISPDLEGWHRIEKGSRKLLLTRDGERATEYPREVQFRVTVSTRDGKTVDPDLDPLTFKSEQPLNDYLLHLRFRVKIFHELRVRVVEPSGVHLMGVPEDVPYNERIYRIIFNLPRIPVQDRMVLEVLSPDGERISRFHFELM